MVSTKPGEGWDLSYEGWTKSCRPTMLDMGTWGHECRIASWTQRAYLLAFLQPFSVCTAWPQLLGLLWRVAAHFLSTSILAGTRALQTDAVSMLVVPPHSFSQHIALPCVCHARDCSRAPSSTLCWWYWPALRTSPLLGSWMRPSASQLRSLLAFGYAAGQTVRIQKGRIGEE